MLIATKLLALSIVFVLAASLALMFIPEPVAAFDARTYNFEGPYSEGSGSVLANNATVTIHFTNTYDGYVSFRNTYNYTTTTNIPSSFEFSYNDSGTVVTREYWLNSTEQVNGGTFKFFVDTDATTVSVNIFNFKNIAAFSSGAFLVVKNKLSYPLGEYVLEKILIDNLGDASLCISLYKTYEISIESTDGEALYVFGDITTVSSAITLTIPAMAFPESTLLQYPYVTFYGTRNLDSNSITLYYNDTKEQTESFSAVFTDSGGTTVYSYSVDDTDSLVLNWTLADDSETYYVAVTVDHALYGDLSWTQTFYKEGGSDTALFSLSFLGDWSFNTAYILPALIVLFIACCFSVLNAEAGALLATIAAIALTLLGWLPIPAGMLVSAFAFSILMALVYAKRRASMY
jgi:hypothetical protein